MMKGFLFALLAVSGCFGCLHAEVVIAEGPDWVRLDYRKDVVPGSALDFTEVAALDAPAGKHGWLKVVDGHFEYERLPGVRQRFHGYNVIGEYCYPKDEAEANRYLDRIAALGANALRLHHFQTVKCSWRDRKDAFDLFVKCAIERGFFITLDLFTSGPTPEWREIGIDRDGRVPKNAYKSLVCYHPGAYRHWLAFAAEFMKHKNRYTGRRIADEPAIGLVSLINEGGPHLGFADGIEDIPEVRRHMQVWAERKGVALAPRYKDNGYDLKCAYRADCERELFARQRRHLAKLGVRALLTNAEAWTDSTMKATLESRMDSWDYLDCHCYTDHPEKSNPRDKSEKGPKKMGELPRWNVNVPPMKSGVMNYPARLAFIRPLGMPLCSTEWCMSSPGTRRGQGGLLYGAIAAAQDWDGLWYFTYSHGKYNFESGKCAPHWFDAASDPIGLMNGRAFACLFLRRDLPPLRGEFLNVIPQGAPPYALPIPEDPQASVFAAKIRSVNEGSPHAKGAAPSPVPTGVEPGYPVRVDPDTGAFAVATARTAGGYGPEGDTIKAGALRARLVRGEAAVWASALGEKPIRSAARIALFHSPDCQGTGTVFGDASCTKILAHDIHGGVPLVRDAEAEVEIALDAPEAYTVFALGTDGSRRFEVPAKAQGGRLAFSAKTRGADGLAVIAYEIARKKR